MTADRRGQDPRLTAAGITLLPAASRAETSVKPLLACPSTFTWILLRNTNPVLIKLRQCPYLTQITVCVSMHIMHTLHGWEEENPTCPSFKVTSPGLVYSNCLSNSRLIDGPPILHPALGAGFQATASCLLPFSFFSHCDIDFTHERFFFQNRVSSGWNR